MEDKFYTQKDIDRERKAFYRFYNDEDTGGLRGFNAFNEELTLQEVEKIIVGLTSSYLNISKNEYKDRTLSEIKYNVEYSFNEYSQGPPIMKSFRKDLKRHYSIKCVNCLCKISTKSDEGYWIAQSYHKQIHGERFCSEWCVNKYIDEIKQNAIKKKKIHYGI